MPRDNLIASAHSGQPEGSFFHATTEDGRPTFAVFDPDSRYFVREVEQAPPRLSQIDATPAAGGWAKFPHGIASDARLGPNDRLTALALLHWAWAPEYQCDVSDWRLADYLVVSEPTVRRSLAKLESLGLIRREDAPYSSRNMTGRAIVLLWIADPSLIPPPPLHNAPRGQTRPVAPCNHRSPTIDPAKCIDRSRVIDPAATIDHPRSGGSITSDRGGRSPVIDKEEALEEGKRRQTNSRARGSGKSQTAKSPSQAPFDTTVAEPGPVIDPPAVIPVVTPPTPGCRPELHPGAAPPLAVNRPFLDPEANLIAGQDLPAIAKSLGRNFLKFAPSDASELPLPAPTPAPVVASRNYQAAKLIDALSARSLWFRPKGTDFEWYSPVASNPSAPTVEELDALGELKAEVRGELRKRGVKIPDDQADIDRAVQDLRPTVARLIPDPAKQDDVLRAIPSLIKLIRHATRFPIREVSSVIEEVARNREVVSPARYAKGTLEKKLKERTIKQ